MSCGCDPVNTAPAPTPPVPDVVAFTYTATGSEGTDFTVPLPDTRADADYIPLITLGTVTVVFTFNCPDNVGDRTTTGFRIILSTAISANDQLDVAIVGRTVPFSPPT